MKTITMKRHLLISRVERVHDHDTEGDNQLTKLPLLIMMEMVEMVEYHPEPLKNYAQWVGEVLQQLHNLF